MIHRYRRDVLEWLAEHGVRPAAGTPPQLVHDFVNDLYRYELRSLRDRLLRKEIARPDYHRHVVAIRNRYPVLSLKTWQWLDNSKE
jgi:hypothetical protein